MHGYGHGPGFAHGHSQGHGHGLARTPTRQFHHPPPRPHVFQHHRPPEHTRQPGPAGEASWRPLNTHSAMERTKVNLADLAGKQMLPLEPRIFPDQTMDTFTNTPITQFENIIDILRHRGSHTATHAIPAFTAVDAKGHEVGSWSWERLYDRAERIGQAILQKTQLRRGARVALVYRKSEVMDFMSAFFGCMLAGMTAVPINVIEDFAEMTYILSYTQTELALTTEYNHKALTRDVASNKSVDWPAGVIWWKTDTLGQSHSKKKEALQKMDLPDLAYIEYTKAPNGELKGVAISHKTILSQCQTLMHSIGSLPSFSSPAQPRSPEITPTTPTYSVKTMGTPTLPPSPTISDSEDPETRTNPPNSSATPSPRIIPYATSIPSTPVSLGSQSMSSPLRLNGADSNHPKQDETPQRDRVMSWLEPRQQVGLIIGGFFGVYRGSHTVFAHSGLTETPRLWEECAQRYDITIAVGEYEGARELIQGRSMTTRDHHTRRSNIHLSHLRVFLIDAFIVQPQLDRQLADEYLSDLGVQSARHVVLPFCSLPEHGGMILSMRDHLPFPRGADLIDFGFDYETKRGSAANSETAQPLPKGHSSASDTICHYLLDRRALRHGAIKVVATGDEALQRSTEIGVMLVGAFGYTTAQATLAVVDPETTALCQPNRVGEIWVDSPSLAFGFWELPKHSQSIFHALPLIVPVDTMIPEVYDPVPAGFLRTGLIGGLIEGRVIVFGLYENRIRQTIYHNSGNRMAVTGFEYHYTTDVCNTVMERIVGFTSCIAFELSVKGERLPVICAETARHQRADLARLSEFVQRAMEDYHNLRVYCIAIASTGSLPRTYKNGKRMLHSVLCRKLLELGRLKLIHIQTSVDDTISRIVVGDDPTGGIWGADAVSTRESALPAHVRMFQYSCCGNPQEIVDERTKVDLSQFTSLPELLVWRTIVSEEDIAFLGLDHRGKDSKAVSFRRFGHKVASIANYIEKRGGYKAGDKIVLLFPNGIDFAATVYACWFLGLVPVPIQLMDPSRLHDDIVLLMGLLTELRISHLIGNTATEEMMRQKTTMIHMKACIGARQDAVVPTVFNISKAPKLNRGIGKESGMFSPPRASLMPTAPAMIFVHYSKDMRRTLVKMTHSSLLSQCKALKIQCRIKTSRPIVSCWKSLAGIGLLMSCALGVYTGAPTVMIAYSDFLSAPHIYFEALERHGGKCYFDGLLNYAMLEQVLVAQDPSMPSSFNFSDIQNMLLYVEDERARTEVHQGIERRFATFGLDSVRIHGMFGHATNPFVTSRSYMNIEPVRLHLSLRALRRGIIQVTSEQDDPTGIWVEDSGIPVCGTTVAIVNPESREICLSREIGEIWVSSESNAQAYPGTVSPLLVEADPASPLLDINSSRFNATLANNDIHGGRGPRPGPASQTFVRTGEVGFLWNYSNDHFNGGRATSLLFVLGPIGETFEVNGLMHFPMDIEATIEKAHPCIAPSGCIVFQADQQAVVCVIQTRPLPLDASAANNGGNDSVVNMILCVMHRVLQEHQFMPDVIAIVGEGVLTKNRFGEKQRGKMLSLFMSAKMPIMHIHYPRGAPPESVPEQQHVLHPASPHGTPSQNFAHDRPNSMFITSSFSPSNYSTASGMSTPVSAVFSDIHTSPTSQPTTTHFEASSSEYTRSVDYNGQMSPSAQSPTEPEMMLEPKPGSIRSTRTSISTTANSLRSARSVGSLVGSIFRKSKKPIDENEEYEKDSSRQRNEDPNVYGQKGEVEPSGRSRLGRRGLTFSSTTNLPSRMSTITASTRRLQGYHGSKSESGLVSLPILLDSSTNGSTEFEASLPPPLAAPPTRNVVTTEIILSRTPPSPEPHMEPVDGAVAL
ncbi:hypothetical protein BGW38_003700 [Lunasporangiospora selenospora]|uniref:Acyl-CoA synthetase (AMP-forming)/AMP-acid ligase II n=1 Tax=Lunasporangiospora selenospora TaxID=979761 RepID=A0A9P6G180_9FUNG|nr:hypothetical protein BGW38_003700 [Lunasporangiospora selenospora]